MEILEEVQAWVAQLMGTAAVDGCGHQPGSLGLFPQGVQVLKTWQDVLGNSYRKVRYRFWLRLVLPPGEAAAKLLLRLQAEAPKRGLQATEGTYRKAASDGLAIYEIRLTAEREETL